MTNRLDVSKQIYRGSIRKFSKAHCDLSSILALRFLFCLVNDGKAKKLLSSNKKNESAEVVPGTSNVVLGVLCAALAAASNWSKLNSL
ncbi:hypothetical protein V1478_007494 [Vespula squamosa]|uniref:Uncharacterized protein n=1 Tax=Vespula squamosa TaxID=30214 RepID=A0ABD2B3F0_VESSQ